MTTIKLPIIVTIATFAVLLASISATSIYALTDTQKDDAKSFDFNYGDKGCDDNHQNCKHVAGLNGLPFCDLNNDNTRGCYDRFDNHDEFCSKHPNDDTCGGRR